MNCTLVDMETVGSAMWIPFSGFGMLVLSVSLPFKFFQLSWRLWLQLACPAAKLEGCCLALELGAKK
jgi:hypothetical protein